MVKLISRFTPLSLLRAFAQNISLIATLSLSVLLGHLGYLVRVYEVPTQYCPEIKVNSLTHPRSPMWEERSRTYNSLVPRRLPSCDQLWEGEIYGLCSRIPKSWQHSPVLVPWRPWRTGDNQKFLTVYVFNILIFYLFCAKDFKVVLPPPLVLVLEPFCNSPSSWVGAEPALCF